MEIGAGASGHNDGGNPEILVEAAHPLDEGDDRLLRRGDHLLHESVTDHEIRGGGVLVDEEQPASGFYAFHQIGGLGGAAAGVLGGEMPGVLPPGQLPDEGGNVRAADAPPVLGAKFPGAGVRDDKLPSVAADMVVDRVLESLQDGGFSVVAAAYEEGDSLWNSHAGYLAPVRERKGHAQGLRGTEGHSSLHGPVRDAAFPGQDGSVRDKGAQAKLRECFPDILLILTELDGRSQLFLADPPVIEAAQHAAGQDVEEHLFQLLGVDGPSSGRKARLEAQNDVSGLHPAGRPLQHLLAAAGGGQEAALSGASGLFAASGQLRAEEARQVILEGNPLLPAVIIFCRKTGPSSVHMHGEPRGSGKGVALHVIDGEHIVSEIVLSL